MESPDGTLQFRCPDGWLFPDVPPAPVLRGDPIEELRSGNEMAAQQIHPWSATPVWHGERLDVGWAIDVLHPLAARARSG